ncbi:uroporphyrinogen-III C-methyltransferase [Marivita hallyeonensis]|uniref:uroporphyrinogen-III C-methyltransferase n=2 Tax=Marivita hallyeonensis TaxID=996342 RepID=A0A1M5REP0_9RHOB|nr:uroporphyrinogen-III C-methyltransferase [Marivita hallyeonensis]SHH24570.1 uroporphyrinogen-III C-methyltransferase [Marivita hallyeonensis]
MLQEISHPTPHPVAFVGAGPGDPELLTVKALRALQTADVVIHDRLVSEDILALVGPHTRLRNAGKEGFGPSIPQSAINALIIEEARTGARVVRLKSGDPTVFGRLDEELDALHAAGIGYTIVPGLTSASAAVATLGQSLTKRGRNTAVRLVTGHDMQGYADQDWRTLARSGEVAAIYMAKRAARFIQGRLLMHGADPQTPVTIVENASRADERIVTATLATLPSALFASDVTGPALLMYGLAPRDARMTHTMPQQQEMI